jgi:hypothetical protein
MEGFFGYIQIYILPMDQQKTAFIGPWGTFMYHKIPFDHKNVGVTFQRDILLCLSRHQEYCTTLS